MGGKNDAPSGNQLLLTRRRAGEQDLSDDADEVHVAENFAPKVDGTPRAKDKSDGGDDERDDKVNYTVGDPREEVERGVGVAGEDVRYVGTIEDLGD